MLENVKSLNNPMMKFIIAHSLSNCNSISFKNNNVFKQMERNEPSEDDVCIATAIKELKNVEIFNCSESQDFINYLCSN